MLNIFLVQGYVMLAVAFVILALTIYAFVTSLLYEPQAYIAADKLTKPTWSIILGLAVIFQVYPAYIAYVGTLISLALLIATLVFLVDVRPALANLRRR